MVTVGDILEWIAAGLLVAASFVGGNLLAGGLGLVLAFVAAAGCLGYFAQCHADTPLRRPKQQ